MTTPADILRAAANEIDALDLDHLEDDPEACLGCRAADLADELEALAYVWENPEEESR